MAFFSVEEYLAIWLLDNLNVGLPGADRSYGRATPRKNCITDFTCAAGTGLLLSYFLM